MQTDYYGNDSIQFPPLVHNDSRKSIVEAIMEFMAMAPDEDNDGVVFKLLDKFEDGADISVREILSFMAGEEVWREN